MMNWNIRLPMQERNTPKETHHSQGEFAVGVFPSATVQREILIDEWEG